MQGVRRRLVLPAGLVGSAAVRGEDVLERARQRGGGRLRPVPAASAPHGTAAYAYAATVVGANYKRFCGASNPACAAGVALVESSVEEAPVLDEALTGALRK